MSNKRLLEPRINSASVHTWVITLRTASDLSKAEATLAKRALANAAQRAILARYFECEQDALSFVRGPKGKPALSGAHAALRFNLSHSGERALCAVSLNDEVGVDIEAIRPVHQLDDLIVRWMHGDEQDALKGLDAEQRLRRFFELWTAKEAFLKAKGTGLFGIEETREPGWQHVQLSIDPAYAAALCVHKAKVELSILEHDAHG